MKKIGEIIKIDSLETKGMSGKEWIQKLYNKIGYDGRRGYLFTGGEGTCWDFTWIDGNLYRRDHYAFEWSKNAVFFKLVRGYGNGDVPHIVCECGSETFSLKYGNYEMIARCSNCKKEECVYDG